jgi:hypothetical protein
MDGVLLIQPDSSLDSKLIDVVLHFGEFSSRELAKFGTGRMGFWFFRFAGKDLAPGPAIRRAAAAKLPFESSLWAHMPDGSQKCIYQSFGFLEAFAPSRSLVRALAKTAHFPQRSLLSYQHNGLTKFTLPESVRQLPGTAVALVAVGRAILHKIRQKWMFDNQWYVVVGRGNGMQPTTEPEWILKPPTDRFWADPFLVERNGRQWVLVEELPFSTWKGHLAAIELLAGGSYGEPEVFMSPETHLSYPFCFEWNDALYLVPENSAANNVVLWKCESFPTSWKPVSILLPGVRAVDSTLIEHEGKWWMFTAIAESGACDHDELRLYFADTPLGPWQPHPQNPIKSDARNSRPAGNLFLKDGLLYRPAQDCSTEYGMAVVINRVDRLDTECYGETQVARIDSTSSSAYRRTHTLSHSKNLWATDRLWLSNRWQSFYDRWRLATHQSEVRCSMG